MKYSKKEIGEDLKKELERGYDIVRISNWAEGLLITLQEKSAVYFLLNRLSLMDAGPEFEYTEQELRMLAELLINDAEDSIKQIDEIKFK